MIMFVVVVVAVNVTESSVTPAALGAALDIEMLLYEASYAPILRAAPDIVPVCAAVRRILALTVYVVPTVVVGEYRAHEFDTVVLVGVIRRECEPVDAHSFDCIIAEALAPIA
jgi:hypothetical protein